MPHWRKPPPKAEDRDELAGFALFVILVVCIGAFIVGAVTGF